VKWKGEGIDRSCRGGSGVDGLAPAMGYYGRYGEYLLPREHLEGQVTPLALTNCQREPQP